VPGWELLSDGGPSAKSTDCGNCELLELAGWEWSKVESWALAHAPQEPSAAGVGVLGQFHTPSLAATLQVKLRAAHRILDEWLPAGEAMFLFEVGRPWRNALMLQVRWRCEVVHIATTDSVVVSTDGVQVPGWMALGLSA
jgi:hypothetical protein